MSKEKQRKIMYRQGDVLLIKSDSDEAHDSKLVRNGIIREGLSGHQHKIVGGKVYSSRWHGLIVVVKKSATLVHPEHKTIMLPKGNYRVNFQRDINSYIQD